jgi:pimeloyl-ACP methyl ester carboxylesterase
VTWPGWPPAGSAGDGLPRVLGFSILAGLLILRLGGIAAAEEGRLALGACEPAIARASELRCGVLAVPENWSRPGGRSIDLHVVVVPALAPRAGVAPLYDLAGGPGLAVSDGAVAYLEDLAPYRQERDVVLLDQRGTGRSHPLHCETEQQGPLDEMYPIEKVRACRERLEQTSDLRQYTTDNSARDIEAVRRELGHERIDLVGLSYGTELARAYLRLFPEHVRAVALLGTTKAGIKTPLYHARDAQRALDDVFDRCEADARCARAFPELRSEWRRLLDRLARGPVTAPYRPKGGRDTTLTVRRDVFGEAFRGVLGSEPWDVPFVIHRAAAGDFQPFFERIPLDKPSPFAEGLYLSVACTEGTSRITDQEARTSGVGTFLGDYRVNEQRRACREWPTGETPDLSTPRTDVPVLLMAGSADYVTPVSWARDVAAQLGNARVVVFDGLTHNPDAFPDLACYDGLILAFFQRPDLAALDAACASAVKPPPFRLSSVR